MENILKKSDIVLYSDIIEVILDNETLKEIEDINYQIEDLERKIKNFKYQIKNKIKQDLIKKEKESVSEKKELYIKDIIESLD